MHNLTYPGANLNSSCQCQCQNEAMLQTLLQRRSRRANHRCTHQLGFKVGLFCNNDVCELRGPRSSLTEVERGSESEKGKGMKKLKSSRVQQNRSLREDVSI